MIDLKQVKGILFDYGATIDSNGTHWAEVLWEAYTSVGLPVTKASFREAYVYGERYLALHPVIKPEHTFKDVLLAKINLQLQWLLEQDRFTVQPVDIQKNALAISNHCYTFASSCIEKAKPVLDLLVKKYPLVLVSNFYGNVEAVLEDFGLRLYFQSIVESAVVGVRKPNPAIFTLGVEALSLPANQVVVIGDSHAKDIVPAQSIGCQTIWIKGPAWEADDPSLTADAVIYDFSELRSLFAI